MFCSTSPLTLNSLSGTVVFILRLIMASNRSKRQEEIRFREMEILHESAMASTHDIARALEMSNGSAYYYIFEYLKKIFFKLKNFKKPISKSHCLYKLSSKDVSSEVALTVKFLERKRQEYIDLQQEAKWLEFALLFSKVLFFGKKDKIL